VTTRFVLAALLASGACRSGAESELIVGNERTAPAVRSTAAEEPNVVELALDSSRRAGPLILRWTAIADSRCPVGVQCVWAGVVRITLLVEDSGAPEERAIELELQPGRVPVPVTAAGHELRLLNVEPVPQEGVAADRMKLRAHVEFRRAPPP
jgi:hypothetical protein